MNSDFSVEDELERLVNNERVRKNIEKFHKTGKFTDSEGKVIDVGSTVNFKIVKRIE